MKLDSRFIAFHIVDSYNLIDTLIIGGVLMEELEVFNKLEEIHAVTEYRDLFGDDTEKAKQIAAHKAWLQSIRRERPSTGHHFKVGIYIRYFNQTKYDNYLAYHKKQFTDSVALCPKWELVDFYIDNGASTPYMENSSEWSRLLQDCMDGKVDLIITQKVSNVSKVPGEIAFCARMLAAQPHPIGIYFISEDIFTLASYYLEDLRDMEFMPSPDWKVLPEGEETGRLLHD